MRITIIGAASAAVLGGALAVTPVSSVSTPMPAGGCGAGCERLASVLMPEAGPPSDQAVSANPAPKPFSAAANVIAPGSSPDPSEPSVDTSTAGGTEPRISTGTGVSSSSGLQAVPGAGLPALSDVDPLNTLGGVGGLNTLAAAPSSLQSVQTAYSILQGTVGVAGSVVGIGTGIVGTASTAAIAIAYLHNAGLLPSSISLPSLPNVSIPALPAAAAALPAVSLPSAAALPAASLPSVPSLPAAGLPSLPSLPAVGLPALPALPAGLPALPAVGPPALPAIPLGPPPLPSIPHPRFCTPSLGPIGVCTP